MTTDLHLLDPTLALSLPTWAVALLVVGFLFLSIVMILIVLIQRPQGGGLSGAFGGGGGSAGQTAFGARTGDALTITTITIFVLYLLAAIFLNFTIAPPKANPAPTLTAASENAADSVAEDNTNFIELPPVVVGSSDDASATTDDADAQAPVGPLPEATPEDAEPPTDDSAKDTADGAAANDTPSGG